MGTEEQVLQENKLSRLEIQLKNSGHWFSFSFDKIKPILVYNQFCTDLSLPLQVVIMSTIPDGLDHHLPWYKCSEPWNDHFEPIYWFSCRCPQRVLKQKFLGIKTTRQLAHWSLEKKSKRKIKKKIFFSINDIQSDQVFFSTPCDIPVTIQYPGLIQLTAPCIDTLVIGIPLQ